MLHKHDSVYMLNINNKYTSNLHIVECSYQSSESTHHGQNVKISAPLLSCCFYHRPGGGLGHQVSDSLLQMKE